jgi:uncharacterized membrane protein YebE (DUF533 family)
VDSTLLAGVRELIAAFCSFCVFRLLCCGFCAAHRLKAQLKARLLEAQWTKELTAHCHAVMSSQSGVGGVGGGGLQNVRLEELVEATQQHAEHSVPQHVREEFREHIRRTIIAQAEADMEANGQQPPTAIS